MQQCHESYTGFSRKSYFIFALQVFPQKNASLTWKLQSDLHDFIKFFAKRQLLLLLLPTTSATSPSNYDVKMFEMNNSLGELSIIIHWEISINHCWKCIYDVIHWITATSYDKPDMPTGADSNSFISPYEILPIANENKYLGVSKDLFLHFI